MKNYLKAIALAAMAFVSANLLSGCDGTNDTPATISNTSPRDDTPSVSGQSVEQSPQVVYQQPQQQVIIVRQPQPHASITSHLVAGVTGYALGRMHGSSHSYHSGYGNSRHYRTSFHHR